MFFVVRRPQSRNCKIINYILVFFFTKQFLNKVHKVLVFDEFVSLFYTRPYLTLLNMLYLYPNHFLVLKKYSFIRQYKVEKIKSKVDKLSPKKSLQTSPDDIVKKLKQI